MARVDVQCTSAPDTVLARGTDAEDLLSSASVAQVQAGGVGPIAVGLEHCQARTLWVDVAEVHGVAVAQPGGVQALSIRTDDAGSVNDVVLAVAVHVADAEVVVALAAILAMRGRTVVAVKGPHWCQ